MLSLPLYSHTQASMFLLFPTISTRTTPLLRSRSTLRAWLLEMDSVTQKWCVSCGFDSLNQQIEEKPPSVAP